MFQVELAFFSSLRQDPQIEFISVPQCQANTTFVLLYMVFQSIMGIINYVSDVENHRTESLFKNIFGFVLYVLSKGLLMYFGRIYFKSLDELERVQKEFDVRKCECSIMEDKPMLLSAINHFMGSSQTTEQGIEKFNNLVKRHLKIHAPFTGPRSFLVVSYIPCVFLSAIAPGLQGTGLSWFGSYDSWASGAPGRPSSIDPTSLSFLYFLSWICELFVVCPVVTYTYLLVIKLAWFIEKLCRVRNVAVLFVLYVVVMLVDTFIPVRAYLCMQLLDIPVSSIMRNWTYVFHPYPFHYWPKLFTSNKPNGLAIDHNLFATEHYYTIPVWGRVIVIIWLIVCALGTYWLFESLHLQRLRLKAWGLLRGRMFLAKKNVD